MYGIVNKAIEDLIMEKFGQKKWSEIKEKSLNNHVQQKEHYPNHVAFDLVIATSEILKIPVYIMLMKLGKYWILNTGKKKFGPFLTSGGDNFKDFLTNLPDLHSRILLIYDEAIKASEFKVENIEQNSLQLYYYTQKIGFHDFITGFIYGLAEIYETKSIRVDLLKKGDPTNKFSKYHVEWID